MSDSNGTTNGGIGFCGWLTLIFITLKLTDYIDWSWWWVLSPLWITMSVIVLIVLIALITVGIFEYKKK